MKIILLFLVLVLSCRLSTAVDTSSYWGLPSSNEYRGKELLNPTNALFPVKDEKKRTNVFLGEVIARWLDADGDDRKMQLIQDFEFIDSNSVRWQVPKDWIIDGASIPQPLWGALGSPFVGEYRKASVIHDYYCDVKTASWKDVHRMFYDASIVSGVSLIKAKIMYGSILIGGPRWEGYVKKPHPEEHIEILGGSEIISFSIEEFDFNNKIQTIPKTWTPVYDNKEFEDIYRWIEKNNPSIEEIEERVSKEYDKK